MAREYGHRGPARRRSAAPNQFLLIVLAFLGGYLAASFFDMEKLSHWVNKQVASEQVAKHEATKAPAHAHAQQQPPKPKFEFYTLLANEKVPAQPNHPKPSAQAQAQVPATPITNNKIAAVVKSAPAAAVQVVTAKAVPPPSKGSFAVQVASFKARKDAEQMKGLLTLKGFNVSVVPVVTKSQGNWFRVIVGPYPNKVLAQQAQGTLAKSERLHGMITSAGG
ncbi:MAG: SPOR domain-containing protein [Legionella sp.]|jgi:cell division protein FtsN